MKQITFNWQKFHVVAEIFNAFRVFPRAFIATYMVILYNTVEWFMVLPDPSTQQAGFVSTIVGVGAAWFGLYVRDK